MVRAMLAMQLSQGIKGIKEAGGTCGYSFWGKGGLE